MTELIITEKPSSAVKVAAALADKAPVKKKSKGGSYFEVIHNKKVIYFLIKRYYHDKRNHSSL